MILRPCVGDKLKFSNVITLSLITTSSFLLLPAQAESSKPTLSKNSVSGLEIRVNALYSSGRFEQEITKYNPTQHVIHTDEKSSDLTTKGFSLLLGYAKEYRKQEQSSFFYMGYEGQQWNDAFDSQYHAFIVGAEGGLGNATIKLIYGGEFAFGALDTKADALGYLSTFTAEPFVGFRVLSTTGLSFNFRVGARGYFIESVEETVLGGSTLSENGAYTANVQLGLGYRFY